MDRTMMTMNCGWKTSAVFYFSLFDGDSDDVNCSNATHTTTTTVAIPKDVQQDRYDFDCIERNTARLA